MGLFTHIPSAASDTIHMDTSPCARARGDETNTDLPLQPMLPLAGAAFVAVTDPLDPLRHCRYFTTITCHEGTPDPDLYSVLQDL